MKKKLKTPPEDSDDSITSLLKVIHADIKVMKGDLKESNQKINDMKSKINKMESKSTRTEQENLRQFQAIKHDMGNLETSVTTKVINFIDPKISTLCSELKDDLCTDLWRLVKEEMELNRHKENKKE